MTMPSSVTVSSPLPPSASLTWNMLLSVENVAVYTPFSSFCPDAADDAPDAEAALADALDEAAAEADEAALEAVLVDALESDAAADALDAALDALEAALDAFEAHPPNVNASIAAAAAAPSSFLTDATPFTFMVSPLPAPLRTRRRNAARKPVGLMRAETTRAPDNRTRHVRPGWTSPGFTATNSPLGGSGILAAALCLTVMALARDSHPVPPTRPLSRCAIRPFALSKSPSKPRLGRLYSVPWEWARNLCGGRESGMISDASVFARPAPSGRGRMGTAVWQDDFLEGRIGNGEG